MSSLRQRTAEIAIKLHRKQGVCLESTATEILYGGAVGGGKSFLMRAAAVMWCGMIPGLQVYLFRRLRDDLVKNHIEGPKGLRMLLSPWAQAGLVTIVEDEIRFWNGSKIYLCHCKDEKDRFKYLGAEIHVLLIDELTTFTETIYRFLRSRVRMVGVKVPPELVGSFPRIVCGSNPGNVGHQWVKAAFIDARPPLDIERMPADEGEMLRQYIPAKLEDNPSMAEDDPGYAGKVSGLGNPELVRAMRDGDWNVVAGAFFPEFTTDLHVVAPRSLPTYWLKFRSFDWGSARPFSVGWWTVSDGELVDFPRGAIIRYREWYGAQRDSSGRTIPNSGLRMTAEEVADGIIDRERGDITGPRTMSGVADPSIFAEDGGPSIADRMAARKVFWRPADNARIQRAGAMGGWDQVRARLKGDGERPALYVFSTCLDLIRTLPSLQHDEGRVEDINTESEDHCFASGTLVRVPGGVKRIEEMESEGFVCTPSGVARYRSGGLVARDAEIVRLSFEDGSTLDCTPDHEFVSQSGQWVKAFDLADEMRYGAISLEEWRWSRLSAERSRSSKDFGIICAGATFRERAGVFIGWCGSMPLVLFQSASMFIMGTKTVPTMISATYGVFPNRITTNFTPRHREQTSRPMLKGVGLPPLSGMAVSMGSSGIASIGNFIARMFSTPASKLSARIVAFASRGWPARTVSVPTLANLRGVVQAALMMKREFALSVGEFSRQTNTASSIHAPLIVAPRLLRCVGVERRERADVYCLTVPETGCFLLGNGLIVSNCADEVRYACMSRPYVAPLPPEANEPEPDGYRRSWKRGRGGRGSAMAA